MALYQDWAMAGSFARRNTEFFLLAEITSKYLADEMRGGGERGGEQEASRRTKKEMGKGGQLEKKETNGREREKSSRGEEKVLDINKENMYERGSFNNLLSQTCYSGSAVIFLFFLLKKCIN